MNEQSAGSGRNEGRGTGSRRGSSAPSRVSRRFKIFRILRRDRPFAVVLVLGILLSGIVLLGVPKMWLVTPDRFPYGETRVSIIDLVQAWSLARSARRAEEAGLDEAALFAWRGAMVNNPADPRWHRGFLKFLGSTPAVHTDRTIYVLRSSTWLMALGGTNVVDVGLAAEVLERYGRSRVGLAWLGSVRGNSSESLDKIRARCLLSSGRFDAFADLWRKRESEWKDDPILSLYNDAWLASTDDRTSGLSANVRLKEALKGTGESGLVAARMLALTASIKGQVDDLGLALAALEARGSASAAQHGFYWKALAASGRRDDAKRLAESYERLPEDPEVAAIQWRSMRDVGATNALEVAEKQLSRFGNDPVAWRAFFDLLADSEKWSELSRAAANARVLCGRQEPLYVEVVFAEYRAARGEGRTAELNRYSEELAVLRSGDPEGVVRIAAALRTGGRVGQALSVLRNHEEVLREWPGFWAELFAAGLASKDLEVLRRSVAELLRIEPNSMAWMNNRAALLLITGEDPAEALRLTLAGLARQPGSYTLRINHALALLANGQAAEAERLLQSIPVANLPSEALANYYLAVAELHAALGRSRQAVEAAAKANREHLLQPQIARLDRIAATATGAKRE